MRRGFTVIEMLVAALLLGMMVTVLTMVFNQSSIAWRTGMATTLDMDDVRNNISIIRDEADNLYVWERKVYRIPSIWDSRSSGGSAALHARAIDDGSLEPNARIQVLANQALQADQNPNNLKSRCEPVNVSQTAGQGVDNWVVNVMSAGPNGIWNDYDDIWSLPDDFD